jgi:uncharacterized protein (TIGR02145 family)
MKTKLFLSFIHLIRTGHRPVVNRIIIIFTLSSALCALRPTVAQVPQGFNYQAIARDGTGNPIINTILPVRITIQSDSLGGTTFWIEEHTSVTTNGFGLFNLIPGKGVKQTGSAVTSFNAIDWTVTPKFIKTEINYSGWKTMGSSRLWAVPYSMVAGDLSGAVKKLAVTGETSDMEEALFEVKNKNGQTVFAVYNEGVRVYVNDGIAKGVKGGFAIGGFGTAKTPSQDYFVVKPDTIRMYIDDTPGKTVKGGFAIGGFSTAKAPAREYLRVTSDSTRIYVDKNAKGVKGGFAIGGFGTGKAPGQEYLRVTSDSTRIYVDDNAKGVKGGFAIGGFGTAKALGQEYLRVTSDSVKVSKSLLIPRLTTSERDNLPFTPGDALIIFNTTEGCMQIYKNNVWSNIWCFNCAPDFIIQPVNNTICSGNNVTFFVSATGTSLSYQWQQSSDNGNTWNSLSNGGSNPAIAGAKGYTLTISNIPLGYHNYKYRCVVAGSCLPNVTSNAVTLNVGSTPPIITLQPANQQLSAGCTANFTVASPGYSVSYRWQQSSDGGSTWGNISDGGTGPVFSGATASTLSLSNVPKTCINYKYRCIVSNFCGADATSTAATLTPNTPPEITVQPVNKLVYVGQNITFNISASGSDLNYQWQESINGGGTWSNVTNGGSNPAYAGANTTSLALSNVPLGYNNYKYRCVVNLDCRPDAISNTATLSVPTAVPITDIDGNTYNTVGIGSQLWMAENLKTAKYNDGTVIPNITAAATWSAANTGAYCDYNNTPANSTTYGRLYNWYAVDNNVSTKVASNGGKNVCPTSWHVPSDVEWTTMTTYLGGQGAGSKLKETGTIHWLSSTGATNETGFTALPGGNRDNNDGTYNTIGDTGFWWSSTESSTIYALFRTMGCSDANVGRGDYYKQCGFSVRCLKD